VTIKDYGKAQKKKMSEGGGGAEGEHSSGKKGPWCQHGKNLSKKGVKIVR